MNAFCLWWIYLQHQLFEPCLSTDDLPDCLQNLNDQYPGYKTSSGFRKCDAEEKWKIASNFIGGYLTTMDVILHLQNKSQYISLI